MMTRQILLLLLDEGKKQNHPSQTLGPTHFRVCGGCQNTLYERELFQTTKRRNDLVKYHIKQQSTWLKHGLTDIINNILL